MNGSTCNPSAFEEELLNIIRNIQITPPIWLCLVCGATGDTFKLSHAPLLALGERQDGSFEPCPIRETEEPLQADGFEEALIGTGWQFTQELRVYSVKKLLEVLMRDMSYEEAREFYDFKIVGAYVGAGTPVFVEDDDD